MSSIRIGPPAVAAELFALAHGMARAWGIIGRGGDLVWLGFPTDVASKNAEFSKLNALSLSKTYENCLVWQNRLVTNRSLFLVLYNVYRRFPTG